MVGVYHGADTNAKRLLTGSHYDTVRNGGKYDGRLGILVPMACVRELHRAGRRLPFGIEVVGFRGRGRPALQGHLPRLGRAGRPVRPGLAGPGRRRRRDDARRDAGRRPAGHDGRHPALQRDPARYLGFVEVHIEQGPVLNALDLPLGVVTSINGSVRCLGEITGMASHAGTTPMGQRRDAAGGGRAGAVRRAARRRVPDVVGTIGMLQVPAGSINVVPGRCLFSLDLRATTDAARDALVADVLAELKRHLPRRGLHHQLEETLRAAAAPSAPGLAAALGARRRVRSACRCSACPAAPATTR